MTSIAAQETAPARSRVRVWFVRLGVVVILLLAGFAGFLWYTAGGMRAVPAFYEVPKLTGQDRLDALANVERKFANFQNAFAADVAKEASAEDIAQPVEPAVIAFESSEIDAYFDKWLRDNGYTERFSQHLGEPRLLLHEGHVVMAGRKEVPYLGQVVVSIRFLPSINDNDKATLAFDGMQAGTTSLPDTYVQEMREASLGALSESTPEEREAIAIEDDGTTNDVGIRVAIDRQLRRLLAGEPVEDLVLFPPVIGRGNVAAKVTAFEIEENQLKLGFVPLTHEERVALVADLKQPPEPLEVEELTDATDLAEPAAG
jgi:hypothetical protein